MADANIGSLPQIESLSDDAKLVVEQQGTAGHITGRQLKEFSYIGVSQYVQAALDAAAQADEAAKKVLEVAASIEGAADEAAAAEAAARAAETAQAAAETARIAAEAARDQAQSIAGGSFLPLAGGTLTGPLILSGSPTQNNGAANKKYVDDTFNSATIMKKATYDPTGEVAAAGGILGYVAGNYVNSNEINSANGVAGLDDKGKISAEQMPSPTSGTGEIIIDSSSFISSVDFSSVKWICVGNIVFCDIYIQGELRYGNNPIYLYFSGVPTNNTKEICVTASCNEILKKLAKSVITLKSQWPVVILETTMIMDIA